MNINKKVLSIDFQPIILSVLSGILSGCFVSLFLFLLDLVTRYRDLNTSIIFGLPLVGFVIGFIYHQFGKETQGGTNLLFDEFYRPQKTISLRVPIFVFFSTLLTHLFGGSAGREGTAVQLGSSLSDQLSRLAFIKKLNRKILIVSGMSAGFSSAIGAPWAGFIFGIEVTREYSAQYFLPCLIASFSSVATTYLFKIKHLHYPAFESAPVDLRMYFLIIVAAIVFAFVSRLFVRSIVFVESFQKKLFRYPPLRTFFAGVILVLFYKVEGSYRYAGLGIEHIHHSLTSAAHFRDPLLKLIFTAIAIGSGFKGGEFVPLVFIGTTLGSAISKLLLIPVQPLASVGFVSVFAAAANVPLTCSVLAIELFGPGITFYAFLGCFVSCFFSGNRGIYHSQKINKKINR